MWNQASRGFEFWPDLSLLLNWVLGMDQVIFRTIALLFKSIDFIYSFAWNRTDYWQNRTDDLTPLPFHSLLFSHYSNQIKHCIPQITLSSHNGSVESIVLEWVNEIEWSCTRGNLQKTHLAEWGKFALYISFSLELSIVKQNSTTKCENHDVSVTADTPMKQLKNQSWINPGKLIATVSPQISFEF